MTGMSDWIEKEMGTVDFGDRRLDARLRRLLERKWQRPGESLSAAGHAEAMAASRFFAHGKVSAEKILAVHRASTLERVRCGGHQRVLLVQDTTECDYSSRKKLVGTGPLAGPQRRGFFVHNHMVVTPERLPLGLWDSSIYARQDAEHGKSADCKNRPIEEKESMRWLEGYRHACALAEQANGCQVISVSDREGDIYEVFAEHHRCRAQDRSAAELLIRSKVDRCLEPLDHTEPAAKSDKIRARLEAASVLGTVTFNVPQAIQRNKKVKGSRQPPVERTARTVEQEVKAVRLLLKPPHRRTGGTLPAVELTVVQARETNPPPGEDPLVWVLLTTLPVETFEHAEEVLELYLCRWEVELLHKVIKSGCRLEEMQQRHDFTLRPAIALYLIIGWRLLYVMRLGRVCPELPCDLVFDENEWKSVVVVLKGRAAPSTKPTMAEMVLMIAKLGGYLGRKKDPPPGLKAMWIGMSRLADFALSWERFGPASTAPA